MKLIIWSIVSLGWAPILSIVVFIVRVSALRALWWSMLFVMGSIPIPIIRFLIVFPMWFLSPVMWGLVMLGWSVLGSPCPSLGHVRLGDSLLYMFDCSLGWGGLYVKFRSGIGFTCGMLGQVIFSGVE